MKEIAAQICDILHDYHVDEGFKFTSDHVLKWVSQFDHKDREFILQEFLHLLTKGIYINKLDAKRVLINKLNKLAEFFKFKDTISFLKKC
jgi:hypothetical protein